MPTARQLLGHLGEMVVVRECSCPGCKRDKTLRCLPPNFKCADVICDFCGYLAQVKTATTRSVEKLPDRLLGAAWGVQQSRMEAGIYFPLFLVLVSGRRWSIYYLSADSQVPAMFVPREPLSASARRAGWRGFMYDLRLVKQRFVRLK